MVECVRWLMLETLRLYLQVPREQAAKIIDELLQFDVPCVGNFEGTLLVQRTDLTAEERLLFYYIMLANLAFREKSWALM
jgi:hypothetical protein